ncbi:hypothetical protein D3C78_1583450 [compost metagenome]
MRIDCHYLRAQTGGFDIFDGPKNGVGEAIAFSIELHVNRFAIETNQPVIATTGVESIFQTRSLRRHTGEC